MIELNSSHAVIQNGLWILLITMARFYGTMLTCPLFSTQIIPHTVKILLSMTFAFIIAPSFSSIHLNGIWFSNVFLIAKELMYGALIGYTLGLPFWVIEAVGNFIDMQRGEQMGAIINQLTSNPDSSIGKLLIQSFLTYYVVAGGFIYYIQVIFKTFLVLPINKIIPEIHNGLEIYIQLFCSYMYLVASLSLPVIGLLFIIDVLMGVIGAFLPQLNITVINMPIKSVAAMSFLLVYLDFLFQQNLIDFLQKVKFLYA